MSQSTMRESVNHEEVVSQQGLEQDTGKSRDMSAMELSIRQNQSKDEIMEQFRNGCFKIKGNFDKWERGPFDGATCRVQNDVETKISLNLSKQILRILKGNSEFNLGKVNFIGPNRDKFGMEIFLKNGGNLGVSRTEFLDTQEGVPGVVLNLNLEQ